MRGGHLSGRLHVEEGRRSRTLSKADVPIALGGPDAAIAVPGSAAPLGWLGIAEGEVFVQPAPGAAVLCNGVRLGASHWLRDGDVLRLGPTRIETTVRADGVHLRVEQLAEANPTEPPVVLVPPPRSVRGKDEDREPSPTIQAIPYRPRAAGIDAQRGRRLSWRRLGLAGLLLPAVLAVAFVVSARSIRVEIEPAPERLALRGRLPAIPLGSRILALAGPYTLVAEKTGFRRLEVRVEVSDAASQTLRYALAPLPGRLVVDAGTVEGAEVSIDGARVGLTPLSAVEVEAGEREVTVRAEGYVEFRTRVAVVGRGAEQRLEVALVPKPLTVRPVRLAPADGVLVLASDPPGAAVSVDRVWKGETPLEVAVAPGRPHEVRLTKAGHEEATLRAELRPGERREETLTLAKQLGEVRIVARPPDAQLLVDGQPLGRAEQTLQLTTVPHEIEIRREGYEAYRHTLTPRVGFPQEVRVELRSLQQVREEARPPVLHTPEGHELRLVAGGRFLLGAPRREPGSRANEAPRDVELVRTFYVATREVSNAQFRRFNASHSSGRAGEHSLDVDDYPVVRVTWQDAVAYCNWLSEREKLPPAYVQKGGGLVAVVPLSTGYRLPTEAEWERVARYVGVRAPLRYPWGAALPVPPKGGNYADRSARGLLGQVLPDYDDGFPVTAPVDGFAPNALGFFHLGDNVAEWVHDLYVISPVAAGEIPRDPTGPAQGEYHVIRGASWMNSTVTELRLSFRDYGKDPRPDLGFRIARYAE